MTYLYPKFHDHIYLDICKQRSERSVLSKFRMSAHSLAIEKGRYTHTERQNHICNSCQNGAVEDEYHFFLICPHYENLRTTFFKKLHIINENDTSEPAISNKNISVLLNSSRPVILKTIINYLNSCYLIRKT